MACFYPTPLEQELMPEEGVLEHDDPVEEDHHLYMMQSCYKAEGIKQTNSVP